MAFSIVFSRSFFRVISLTLAGLVALAAVAACGSDPEPAPAEVVSEGPAAATANVAPVEAAPQPATDNATSERPADPVPSRPQAATATPVVVAPASARPNPGEATDAATDEGAGAAEQSEGPNSAPAAAAFSFRDIAPDATWGDVFNSFSDEEQECIRNELGDEAVDATLEEPFGLNEELREYGDTLIGCVSQETAQELTLAEMDAQTGGLSAEQEGCLRELLGNYKLADLAKASSPDATPEQAMQMLSYALGLLGCLPELANEAAGPGSGPPTGDGQMALDPSFLWSFPTGGWVVTAPAAAEGMVYAGSDDGNLYALSADTGELQWSFATGDVIRSTPTVADGKVFFGSNDNHLYALDADSGSELWKYDTGDWVQHSPSVAGGMVYFGAPSQGDRKVHAVDAATGEVIWVAGHPFPIGASHTPTPLGDKVYAQGSEYGQFYALNAATGETLWQAEVGGYVESAPTVVDSVVYLTVANRAYAFREATGEVIWEVNTEEFPARDFPALVVDGVYYLAPSSTVYALDASSGTELWSYDAANLSTAPVAADGVFYGASELAEYIFALDASTGEELWTLPSEDFQSYSLSLVDGRLYGQLTEGQLYALNAALGEDVWYFEAGGFSDVQIYTVADGVIFSGGPNNSVYAHRAP
ncbi:MAG: PQQ-binding-like beta-propeller repeat protein [Chloroflexota bacterium]|nr:PQQ-binding-like beta-propeller repeat protein [Chloroflexota bacterium]